MYMNISKYNEEKFTAAADNGLSTFLLMRTHTRNGSEVVHRPASARRDNARCTVCTIRERIDQDQEMQSGRVSTAFLQRTFGLGKKGQG